VRLRLLFFLWPALTVTRIANTVARRYGTVEQMELYPHLEDLFGARIDATSRRRIAGYFRNACRRLGMAHRRQLGLPVDPADLFLFAGGTGRLVGRARFEPLTYDRPQRLPRGEYEAISTGRFLGPEEVEAA
jgi:hypothetical protein